MGRSSLITGSGTYRRCNETIERAVNGRVRVATEENCESLAHARRKP